MVFNFVYQLVLVNGRVDSSPFWCIRGGRGIDDEKEDDEVVEYWFDEGLF